MANTWTILILFRFSIVRSLTRQAEKSEMFLTLFGVPRFHVVPVRLPPSCHPFFSLPKFLPNIYDELAKSVGLLPVACSLYHISTQLDWTLTSQGASYTYWTRCSFEPVRLERSINLTTTDTKPVSSRWMILIRPSLDSKTAFCWKIR